MGAVVGIDEVGRGCWAGPLVVAAVALGEPLAGLRDSKRLSARQRFALLRLIQQTAESVQVVWISAGYIDQYGLGNALKSAFTEVAQPFQSYDELVLDGQTNYLKHLKHATAIIKADQTVPAVSAASVVAKVLRDQYMKRLHTLFPDYGFASHVGYGTLMHRTALAQFGGTPFHRYSYKPVRLLCHQ